MSIVLNSSHLYNLKSIIHTLSFVKANATVALAEYVGMFDVVQCRSVAKHVRL